MLKPLGKNIWIADGPVVTAAAGFHYPTRMVVIRLADGRLFIWSPIALTSELREEVGGLGIVACLVAPNHLHHVFLGEWQTAFPQARCFAAPGVGDKRPDLDIHSELSESPDPAWKGEIDQVLMTDNRITTEAVFFHRASGTVIFTDLLQSLPRNWFTGWRKLIARLDLMTEAVPTVPRKFRLAFRDKAATHLQVATILSWPAENLIMAHGDPEIGNAKAILDNAFRWL